MRKEKTLSLILAGLIGLSQIGLLINFDQKAYASIGKDKSEITSKSAYALRSGNQNEEKIDIDTSLKIKLPEITNYPEGKLEETKWIFTIKNNSNRDVYLGEVLAPGFDYDKSRIISKNIFIRRLHIKAKDLYSENQLKNSLMDVEITDPEGKTGKLEKRTMYISSAVTNYDMIESTLKLYEPLRIPAHKSLDVDADTLFFGTDYDNPFDTKKWRRKDGLTEKDSKFLLNADISMSLKANLYYDRYGKEPIKKDELPEGSNFNDQASGSFKFEAKVGDLSFGDGSKNPSEILIKKPSKEFKAVAGEVEAKTNDTLRFVVPVKISDANDVFSEPLTKAEQNQYLINPSFLVDKEDDDASLDQDFYLRTTKDGSLVPLDRKEVKKGGKSYYKLSLSKPDIPNFMEEFYFVYDVKFTNDERTHGLDKKVKLDFDNPGKVIKTNTGLTIDLKAAYLEATEEYQVNFDMANHGEIKSQSVKKGQRPSEPSKPEADGYIFDGWYADREGTKVFNFDEPITKDTTIYAKWAKEIKISYEFISGSPDKKLPDNIKQKLEELEVKKVREGEEVKAPEKKFEKVEVENGSWTFAGWNKKELEVSESNNKFIGTWIFAKNEETDPQAGHGNEDSNKDEETDPSKPGEGVGENTGDKDEENENPDNPKKPESGENEGEDKKDDDKDKPSVDSSDKDEDGQGNIGTDPSDKRPSGEKDKDEDEDTTSENDKKPSIKPVETKAPSQKVIRVNTDIYSPIPKGYQRIYFNPGKDGYLKYNPSFDYGEVIAFDVKETMTFGQAKAEDKGLVVPIAIPKDKSLKFTGWSPKLQADGEFIEGVKYVALYEKIDKDQVISDDKKHRENSHKKGQVLVKSNEIKNDKDKKGQILISDGEISQKEIAKTQNSLPNKAKAQIKESKNPKTGLAGLDLVSGILILSSAGLFLSKKSK